jgi:hypothetical protein
VFPLAAHQLIQPIFQPRGAQLVSLILQLIPSLLVAQRILAPALQPPRQWAVGEALIRLAQVSYFAGRIKGDANLYTFLPMAEAKRCGEAGLTVPGTFIFLLWYLYFSPGTFIFLLVPLFFSGTFIFLLVPLFFWYLYFFRR